MKNPLNNPRNSLKKNNVWNLKVPNFNASWDKIIKVFDSYGYHLWQIYCPNKGKNFSIISRFSCTFSSMLSSKKIKFEYRKNLLTEEFNRRCKKNSRYTLRAFARDLDLEPSSVSQLLRGRRNCSDVYLENICKLFSLTTASFRANEDQTIKQRSTLKMIPEEHNFVRANWYCFAILELTHLKEFNPSIPWIAKTLRLHVHVVENAVRKLIEVGALVITKNDQWIDNYGAVTFIESEDMDIESGRQHQISLLDCAKASVETNLGVEKSHTNITFAMSKEDISEYKQLIKDFRDLFFSRMQNSFKNKDSVYCVQINFFPLTNFK